MIQFLSKTTYGKIVTIALFFAAAFINGEPAKAQKSTDLKYYDVEENNLPVLGKGFQNSGSYFSRLPIDIKGVVREAVWDLGQNSSGIAVRFYSNSPVIGVKWELLNNFNMFHMTGAGIRGLDLYTLEGGEWLFVGTAQPYKIEGSNKICRAIARSKIEPLRDADGNQIGDGGREYLLYLPLYDGALKVEVGVDSSSSIGVPKNLDLVPQAGDKPIVFYGTSVTQGGCASRPGMSYTSIIERKLHTETINLGFSGNGRMDKIMADKISTIKAKAFFIDCLANCTYQIVKDSTEYFIKKLAGDNPDVPLFMLSNYAYPYQYLDSDFRSDLNAENSLWYAYYLKFKKEGYNNLHFLNLSGAEIVPEELLTGTKVKENNLESKKLVSHKVIVPKERGGKMETSAIGPDHEATVDGVHMTDLGFLRFADELVKFITPLLNSNSEDKITEENYLKVDKKIWDDYEANNMYLYKLSKQCPNKKDSLRNEMQKEYDTANRLNVEAAIKYAAVPSGIQRVFMVRGLIPKETLKTVLKCLPDSIKSNKYAEAIEKYIMCRQIEEGDKYYNFKAFKSDGSTFKLSDYKGKEILLIYGGLGCMGEEGREYLDSLYNKRGSNNFEIVVFWPTSSLEGLSKIIKQYKYKFLQVSDFCGDITPFKIRYGCQATPTCYFIDKKGIVKLKMTGLHREKIYPLLK